MHNPYVDNFYARLGQTTPATGRLLTGLFWEPFAYGGNPIFPGGARYESRSSERWGANARIKGEFSEGSLFSFLNGVNYDYAVTGGMTTTLLNRRDLIVSRVQNALRGYGGPGCNAVDAVPTDYSSAAAYDASVGIQSTTTLPGTNGCQWFNPFASAWSTSLVNGAANPSYGGPAFENSLDLVSWMHGEKPQETQTMDLTVDVVYSGQLPWVALPGGSIGWAAGSQWRQEEIRVSSIADGDDYILNTQRCVYPDPSVATTTPQPNPDTGNFGCVGEPGAYWGTGYIAPSFTDQQVLSFFAEAQLPILDNLDAQLAVRREDYGGLAANTYKAAAKWQALDWLAFRGSWSTNYAPPPADIGDTSPVVGTAYISTLTAFFPTLRTNTGNIKPEEAEVTNFGVLLDFDTPGGGALSASVDYFSFDITEQIVTTSVNTILTAVGQGSVQGLNRQVNCSSPYVVFLAFNTGSCTQGASTLGSITQVFTYQTNGPAISTAGIDFGLNYSMDLFGGDLSLGLSGTRVTEYEVGGYRVQGVQFDTGGDRLGFSNASRTGDFSSELRGNLYAGYGFGPHNFRAQMNYTQGVEDERGVPVAQPQSTFGIFPEDYMDVDLHYRYEPTWIQDFELRVSVLNATNEDPMRYQTRNSYYTGVGNPRGRQIEISAKKTF